MADANGTGQTAPDSTLIRTHLFDLQAAWAARDVDLAYLLRAVRTLGTVTGDWYICCRLVRWLDTHSMIFDPFEDRTLIDHVAAVLGTQAGGDV